MDIDKLQTDFLNEKLSGRRGFAFISKLLADGKIGVEFILDRGSQWADLPEDKPGEQIEKFILEQGFPLVIKEVKLENREIVLVCNVEENVSQIL